MPPSAAPLPAERIVDDVTNDAADPPAAGGAVGFELYSSSFCAACARTRSVLGTVTGVLRGTSLREYDIASHVEAAEAAEIEATPTVIIRDAAGAELFRATGVPTVDQVLTAVARSLPRP